MRKKNNKHNNYSQAYFDIMNPFPWAILPTASTTQPTTMSLFSYDEPPISDGQPPMPSPQTESMATVQRQNDLIQNLWQSFLTSTTAHGIGRVFQSESKLKKLAWLISILCMYFVVFKTIVSVRITTTYVCHFEKKVRQLPLCSNLYVTVFQRLATSSLWQGASVRPSNLNLEKSIRNMKSCTLRNQFADRAPERV